MAPLNVILEKLSDSSSPPFTLHTFHLLVHKNPPLVYATDPPPCATLEVYYHAISSPLLVAVWNQTNSGHHLTPNFINPYPTNVENRVSS